MKAVLGQLVVEEILGPSLSFKGVLYARMSAESGPCAAQSGSLKDIMPPLYHEDLMEVGLTAGHTNQLTQGPKAALRDIQTKQ